LVLEYASGNFSNDDPLDKDNDGVWDLNPVSGRYEGNWDELSIARCDDPGLVWSSDPTVIGIDDVNMVRVRGATATAGVVMPGFSHYRSDEWQPNWTVHNYLPSPENTSGRGDRMTFTRVIVDVAKSTAVPLAAPGTATAVLAGNSVIWQLDPVVSSSLAGGGSAGNVVLTDTLPPELSYDHACTLATAGGVPPTSVAFNTPSTGETTLTWTLGSLSSNTAISPILPL